MSADNMLTITMLLYLYLVSIMFTSLIWNAKKVCTAMQSIDLTHLAINKSHYADEEQ